MQINGLTVTDDEMSVCEAGSFESYSKQSNQCTWDRFIVELAKHTQVTEFCTL